METVED